MFKSIFQLVKIARKLALSGAVTTISEVYNIPFSIKMFFDLFSIGSKKKQIFKGPTQSKDADGNTRTANVGLSLHTLGQSEEYWLDSGAYNV